MQHIFRILIILLNFYLKITIIIIYCAYSTLISPSLSFSSVFEIRKKINKKYIYLKNYFSKKANTTKAKKIEITKQTTIDFSYDISSSSMLCACSHIYKHYM